MSNNFKNALDNSLSKKTMKSSQFSTFKTKNTLSAKKSLISFDLTNQTENKNTITIGERLYRKSIAMRDLKEKNAVSVKKKKEIETLNNCSFRPKILEDTIMLSIRVIIICFYFK